METPSGAEVQASEHELESAQPESQAGSEILLDPQDVACLAYEYWHDRGCPCDSTLQDQEADWFRAESELRARIAGAAAQPSVLAEPTENTKTRAAGA